MGSLRTLIRSRRGDASGRFYATFRHLLHTSRLIGAALLVVGICLTVQHVAGLGLNPSRSAAAQSLAAHTQAPTSKPVTEPSTSAASSNKASTTETSSTPLCSQALNGLSASPLNLANAGLTPVVDSPEYYTVYGNNPAEIAGQMLACAPIVNDSSYLAATTYWLGVRYTLVPTSYGMCRIANAGVGTHVTQAIPTWQATAPTNTALQAKWRTFQANLQMHENGHTTIILEHATTLLRSLETHEDISCTNAGITIARMVQQAVATINAANDAYDTQTQHGAKQGAAW